jgi:hypothetical protein
LRFSSGGRVAEAFIEAPGVGVRNADRKPDLPVASRGRFTLRRRSEHRSNSLIPPLRLDEGVLNLRNAAVSLPGDAREADGVIFVPGDEVRALALLVEAM